jgi:hypothetical protein
MLSAASIPALAKSARTGTHSFKTGKKENQGRPPANPEQGLAGTAMAGFYLFEMVNSTVADPFPLRVTDFSQVFGSLKMGRSTLRSVRTS